MRQETNETSEMWKAYHLDQQRAKLKRKEKNLAALRSSTIPFELRNDGDVVLIRATGYPDVDFWPSVNKWKTSGRYVVGDATALIEWLKRRALR